MLVTVNGPVSEKLTITDFTVNKAEKTQKIFQSGPVNFVEHVKNEGNVHEQPAGHVVITDMFGRKVASVNVNLPPRNILPASTRKFEQPLDKTVIGKKKLFGRYKADLSVVYGKDKKTATSSLTFWVIPYRLVAIVIVLLVAGFFAIRFGIKRYNRFIIGQSGKRRR
jgi:hypothetical protein